jgi:hypothetical protein
MASLKRINLKLLSIDDIKAGLDKEFLPLEPMLTGFRLIEKVTPSSAIEDAEKKISIRFPDDFREIIAKYDFGNLTVGFVAFCASGNYLNQLIELNSSVKWWGHGERPVDVIMIGNSDPFAILMDAQSGSIYALDSEIGWGKSRKIADSFFKFFLALGTVVLKRNQTKGRQALVSDILEDVGGESSEFWINLAS